MANRALLVGINKYKMANSDLSGCVNDVTNVRDSLLKFFGFKIDDIRVITDDRATKKAIMERLTWLVKGAKAGDRLLFHFSGHGSQVRDRDGDELKDKMDEILCPHDMDWDGTYIVDDELRKVFSGLPKGCALEVLLDSCHSGTGTRELMGLSQLPPEQSFKPRFLPPPADILCRVDDDLPTQHLLRGNMSLNATRSALGALPEYLVFILRLRRQPDLRRCPDRRELQRGVYVLLLQAFEGCEGEDHPGGAFEAFKSVAEVQRL